MGIAAILLMTLVIACGDSKKEPQQYSGVIEFDSSKNVVLDITLSANAKQITEIKLTAEKLHLSPENVREKQNGAKGGSSNAEFIFLEGSSMQTTFANAVVYGSGQPTPSHLEFTGSFASQNAIDVNNGKLLLTEGPMICNLTITSSHIYGEINVEISGGGTKTANVELKNITPK
jgi:hypothetical protein